MKNLRLFALSAILALASALPLAAQTYGANGVLSGGTNNVAAFSTNTWTTQHVLGGELRNYSEIGLLVSYKQASATSSNITVRFAKSLDGTTYETVPSLVVFVNATNYITNLTIGSAGFLRLSSIENTNAALALTNVTVTYSIKPLHFK